MADLRRRPPKNGLEKTIWVSKIGFFLLGILAFGVAARLAVPTATGVLASALPRFWASLCSWLVPPYLFVFIQFIVLAIWKLSDQKQPHRDPLAVDERKQEALDPVKTRAFELPPTVSLPREPSDACTRELETETSTEPSAESGDLLEEAELAAAAADSAVENDSTETTWKAIMEKPSQGRDPRPMEAAEANGGEPSATSAGESDSMEATWKAIMEKSSRETRPLEAVAITEREPSASAPEEESSPAENDSMEATWNAIMERSSRGSAARTHL
ncbi:hypothetical protein MUK42_10925 [Musa troglodytarum]|uniref:DUF4408 domain-containing protein n=1 Tax=Musa troglodytarum TaxID=320322 RepID=A0A9E7KES2_9LILI|nr:hypothetical protein MUK42_10925 [Musa troglodytarum]